MSVVFAQYGILHAHAAGKAAVLKANPDVDFRGVFEPAPDVRADRGSAPAYQGVHWFDNKEEMLEDDSIEGIAIEGSVAQNLGFAKEAIDRGKHIWLDKPAGDDWEVFQSLIESARAKELLVQLGYMFRYNEAFQFILDWARSGRLGEVFSVRGRMASFTGEDGREGMAVHEGGILFELLCHLMDIVVHLMGRPDKISSFLRNDLSDGIPRFRDNAITVFEYSGGIATLETNCLEVEAFPARRFEVYGTCGSVVMEPLEPNPVLRLCLDEDRDGYKKGWQVVPVQVRPRYVESLEAIVADIRGDKKPDRSLDHELAVQETVLRAAGIL